MGWDDLGKKKKKIQNILTSLIKERERKREIF